MCIRDSYTDKQQLTSKKQDLDQLGLALRDNPNQTNRDPVSYTHLDVYKRQAEGRDRFAKIYDSRTDFSQLSVDDMKFGLQRRENIARERKLEQLRGAYYTDKQQLTSKKPVSYTHLDVYKRQR